MGLLETLAAGGAAGAILAFALAMLRIAVGAERRRADDWRHAADTAAAANTVNSANVEKLVDAVRQQSASLAQLIGSVGQLATGQQDMMTLQIGRAHV